MGEERRAAENFTRELSRVLGDDLVAVALYGSAARGDYRTGVSDLNVLVLVRALGIETLRAVADPVRDWRDAGNPPPMMLSEAEWRDSADVFPIEYSDIRGAHALLLGDLRFADLRIHADHLRLQLEHELRSAKIQFREGILAAGGDSDRIGGLLAGAVPTLLAYFRAALRLAGKSVPRDAAAVVEATASLTGFDSRSFLGVLDSRGRGADPPPISIDDPIVTGYLHTIESVTDWVDRLSPAESADEVI